MTLLDLILIVIVLLLAAAAFKFLVGMAKTIISLLLFGIAIALLLWVLTGHDILGVGATAGAVIDLVS